MQTNNAKVKVFSFILEKKKKIKDNILGLIVDHATVTKNLSSV